MKRPGILKGAIHVHSDFSDGDSPMEEIIEAAGRAGLDYLIITDHDRLHSEQYSYQRRYGELLVICGYELTFRGYAKNHVLVLGVPSHLPYKGLPFYEKMRRIAADGGRLFIAHPWRLFKPWLLQLHLGWGRWPGEHFDGLEIWSFLHDWVGALRPTKFLKQYSDPVRYLQGPKAEVLAKWDRLNLSRPVAAIGSLDNHARKIPFTKKSIFDHYLAFNTVLTYVESAERFGEDLMSDVHNVLDALADGRSIIANNAVAAAEDFDFCLRSEDGIARAGRSVGYRPQSSLHIDSPVEAQVRIIRNGEEVYAADCRECDFRPSSPGVYRAEARIDGRPWLFTNHIRILPKRPEGIPKGNAHL